MFCPAIMSIINQHKNQNTLAYFTNMFRGLRVPLRINILPQFSALVRFKSTVEFVTNQFLDSSFYNIEHIVRIRKRSYKGAPLIDVFTSDNNAISHEFNTNEKRDEAYTDIMQQMEDHYLFKTARLSLWNL